MKNIFTLLFFFFTLLNFSQANTAHSLVDTKMKAIPASSTTSTTAIATFIIDNFKTEKDQVRASFYYTAANISYDVANMFDINVDETTQQKIAKTLKSKKGVCIHYAEIFNDINNKMGIQSYVIEGYTKKDGKVGDLAHAWNAAKIDNKWYIFDPTWGSGYVNKGKFFKKMSTLYFKADPAKMIVSHIPFDYLWQFLNYPITNSEFYEGKIQVNKSKKYFDFEKELAIYTNLKEEDQLFESAERIKKNGLKNGMIVDRYQGKKRHLTTLRVNNNIEKLNTIVNEMNEAVVLLNDFIYYRNNKFKPNFPDEEISKMIEIPKEKLKKCAQDIYKLEIVNDQNANQVAAIKKNLISTLSQAEEHAVFVKNYLTKSKIVRKTMFSKVSWFGIPLH
jgi:transglutaminase/protease-like cytokinesis protein 3